jgi:hypothetical protein
MILRNLFLVAALLCTLSAAAAGKVEVTGDTSHGTVQSSVQGSVVTFIVTPAEGYYIRKSDITASKSFMPTAETRRRSKSVPVSDELTLVGNDPDDLSQPRTYTVTLPGEEYDVILDVQFTEQQRITEQMVTLSETLFVYNEQEQRPVVLVAGLQEGVDFSVTYAEPTSVTSGTYTLTVAGRSTWQGTVERTYKIFAGGKAEVNKNITGGIIATSVDGLTVTLTVTPADGYYIRKEDILVEKTFMPVESARRAAPISNGLTINGDDPDDLSLPRTYTVELPGWEYDALVNADFKNRQKLTDGMVSLSATSFVYNGKDQKPQISVRGLVEGKDYTVIFKGTSWSDVGTYSVDIVGRSTWIETISRTYTITKAPSVVTEDPKALTLTYVGEPQTLITAGDAIGGTLLYSVDGENYLANLPMATVAGSYIVYYKVQGDGNHADSEVKTVTVIIGKKDITISGITAEDKVYDRTTAVTLNYDAVAFSGLVKGDGLTVTAKGAFVDANAGKDKQVTISELKLDGQSIANYQLAAEGQQTIATATISKAACVVAKAPVPSELTYTGAPQTLAEAGECIGGVIQYTLDKAGSFSPAIPTGIDAGTYTLYYYVAGDQNHENTDIESISITIKEKVIDKPVIELAEETFVYDGTAKTPAVAVKDGETIIPTSEYTIDYKANVDAGEGKVVITDVEGGNYTVSGYAGFIIKKAQLTAIAENKMMEMGTPIPELTVRHKGFVNDETEDVISKPSVAICEEIAESVAGIYTIMVQAGEAANYDIVGENGTLTVFVPQVLADEAGNEVEASVTVEDESCHVVITELTEEMLSGKEDIPASLKDGEGETYQVTEVASEAFEEKPSNIIIALPEGVSTTNPVTNVINGDGTCETLDLTEVSGFETDKPLQVENVVYERAVEQGETMTVCLPYDCDVPQDATVYVLDATTDGNVSFTPLEGNTLEAYQPYLMQMNQAVPTQQSNKVRRANEVEGGKLRLGAKNVSIAPTQEDAATSVGDFKLCGTVKGLTHAEGYNMKAYVMQPDLTWRMTASAEPKDADKQYLAPFQAYMLMVGGDGSEVIGTDIEDVVPTIRVTIGEAGYATAYLTVPVTAPEGVTVYTGKIAEKNNNKYLALTELDGTIPAQTAVILKGNAGTYTFNVADEADPIEDNDLKGSFEAVDAAGKYILAKVGDKVGFYKAGSGKIDAGKAYLESSANVKVFYFTEDDATGIVSPLGDTGEGVSIYNVAGQRINKLQKGINIVNGKKILK